MMSSPISDEENTSEGPDGDTFHEEDEGTAVLADALLENRLTTQNNCISSRPVYVGGAACTAFATRLGYHIRGNTQSDLPCIAPVLKHAGLQRSIQCEVNLPTRAYTQVLVQVVLRYIGQEYHLLRRRSYYEEVDRIYQNPHGAKQISLCKLFVVLALGELYLKKSCSIENGERAIPGTQFFLQAVSLFQEHYEEPDISYIETLLLLVRAIRPNKTQMTTRLHLIVVLLVRIEQEEHGVHICRTCIAAESYHGPAPEHHI